MGTNTHVYTINATMYTTDTHSLPCTPRHAQGWWLKHSAHTQAVPHTGRPAGRRVCDSQALCGGRGREAATLMRGRGGEHTRAGNTDHDIQNKSNTAKGGGGVSGPRGSPACPGRGGASLRPCSMSTEMMAALTPVVPSPRSGSQHRTPADECS